MACIDCRSLQFAAGHFLQVCIQAIFRFAYVGEPQEGHKYFRRSGGKTGGLVLAINHREVTRQGLTFFRIFCLINQPLFQLLRRVEPEKRRLGAWDVKHLPATVARAESHNVAGGKTVDAQGIRLYRGFYRCFGFELVDADRCIFIQGQVGYCCHHHLVVVTSELVFGCLQRTFNCRPCLSCLELFAGLEGELAFDRRLVAIGMRVPEVVDLLGHLALEVSLPAFMHHLRRFEVDLVVLAVAAFFALPSRLGIQPRFQVQVAGHPIVLGEVFQQGVGQAQRRPGLLECVFPAGRRVCTFATFETVQVHGVGVDRFAREFEQQVIRPLFGLCPRIGQVVGDVNRQTLVSQRLWCGAVVIGGIVFLHLQRL